jgi:hypothetical protein
VAGLSPRFSTRPVQSLINPINHPAKVLLIHELAERSQFIFGLLLGSSLSDPFPSRPNFRSENSLRKLGDINTEQVADLVDCRLRFRGDQSLV